eukprot:CAMPEP_0183523842 /NCGR_PEP_ID=MMETSP0371-20130417/19466_1 /TAXON_ID=268820 /ORGANISM="Peridinium aciculiferum, Strain PAER-2" /LENGTH=111 /DNA_ID=CAMNT_0025722857 /DNA_START=23 /DNA_END=355 /DNA_ORIENTATION=-
MRTEKQRNWQSSVSHWRAVLLWQRSTDNTDSSTRQLQAAQKSNSKSISASGLGGARYVMAPPDGRALSLARPAAVLPAAPATCWRAAWAVARPGASKPAAEVLSFRRWRAA